MRSRVPFEPGSTPVLAVLGGIAVAVAACWWWWGRPQGPVPVTRPPDAVAVSALPTSAPPTAGAVPVGGPSPGASVGSSPATITVDVRGTVASPGPRELPAGSRVMDAVAAAGGTTGRYGPVNLARVLTDGEQVRVGPGSGAIASPVPVASGGPTAAAVAAIDLNTATEAQLEELDGIGPVLAAAIVQWRTDNGPFTSVDDLLDVSGIGDQTLAGMRDQVTVG